MREFMRREFPRPVDFIESRNVWRNAFYRTPELADYLRHREIEILRGIPAAKKSSDFILGQLSENQIYTHFDIPNRAEPRKVEMADPMKKVKSKKSFFERFGYADETKSEEGKGKSGVRRDEEKSSGDPGKDQEEEGGEAGE